MVDHKKSNMNNPVNVTATYNTVKTSLLLLLNRFVPLQNLNENNDPLGNSNIAMNIVGCAIELGEKIDEPI